MPNLGLNYIDLLILLCFLFFASEAWRMGFWVIVADFLAFLGSLIVSFSVYKIPAGVFETAFSISKSISSALGFLAAAIITETILGLLFGTLLLKLPNKFWKNKWHRYLAVIPALGEAVVLVSFVLTLILAFPVNPKIKKDISESKIGGYIIKNTSGVESRLNDVFGGVVNDSLTYFSVKQGSGEVVHLDSGIDNLTPDKEAENKMFDLVNEERSKIAIDKLELSSKISEVARNYAKDMWERKYFGHYSPEGANVGDRLSQAKISFFSAGENLALAPTVTTAHAGLMNSAGHRENILENKYHKVGIGVIDNGIYGKIFVQIFTD